ncbi:MAG: hypothetical protein AAGF33_09525 [Pseudomonadota bacterium]
MQNKFRIHVHLVGEANIGFLSQIAFFVHSLCLTKDQHQYSVRCFLGGEPVNWEALPEHIQRCKDKIEIIQPDKDTYQREGMFAQCDEAFLNIRPDADIIVYCDCDTFWLKSPVDLYEIIMLNRTVAGTIVHFPPPEFSPDVRSHWNRLFDQVLSSSPTFNHTCSLGDLIPSPFCPNFAFVAMTAESMREHGSSYIEITTRLRSMISNPYFSYQIGLSLWLKRHNISSMAIPLQYNFPNDDKVFERYSFTISDIFLVHYLRERSFKRNSLFVSIENFEAFLAIPNKSIADQMLAEIWTHKISVIDWMQSSRLSKSD